MQCDVLLVSNLYPPLQIGGYEIAAHDVASSLRDHGMNVVVLTSNYRVQNLNYAEPLVLRQLKLVNSWFNDYRVLDVHAHARYNYEKTAEVIQRLRPKLLYVWNPFYLGVGFLEATVRAGVPILHHVMDVGLLSYLSDQINLRTIIARCFKHKKKEYPGHFVLREHHMHNMIFLSRYMQDYFEHAGVRPKFGTVIYPGIPVERVTAKSNYELTEKVVNVVYVGQLAPHKGVLQLKEALCHLKTQRPALELTLTLYGDGESNFVRGLLSESNILIEHKGFVTKDILYQQLCNYDVGVFPTTWQEPFGIAQIELMASGLPLLTSATGGAVEPVRADNNAIVFKAGDVQDLTAKLSLLIDQYAEKGAFIGRNARQTIEHSFTKHAMNQKVLDAVEYVIRDHEHSIVKTGRAT